MPSKLSDLNYSCLGLTLQTGWLLAQLITFAKTVVIITLDSPNVKIVQSIPSEYIVPQPYLCSDFVKSSSRAIYYQACAGGLGLKENKII